MPHSFISVRVHYVFSTKERRQLIPRDLEPRLWAFIGGIGRANGMTAIAVGGIEDLVHALIDLSAETSIAKAMQLIKAGSSKFMNEQLRSRFEWQIGYFAASVSASRVKDTIKYINTQREHHKRYTFAEELEFLMRKNGLAASAEASD